LYLLDASTGYAVGDGGLVLKTIDGGQNWIPQSSGTGNKLRTLSLNGDMVGYAVGDRGEIIKTRTGGDLWTSQLRGTVSGFQKLFFANADTGLAVATGEIAKTTDGGVTWTSQPSQVPGDAADFYFVNSLVGWAVGSKSMEEDGYPLNRKAAIAKTIDGGITWIPEYSKNPIDMRSTGLNSVHFCDAVHGWAVGRSSWNSQGIIFRTTDGGATWDYGESGIYCNITGVFALDEKHVWAVGSADRMGFIMSSEDGGITWDFQNPSTSQSFNSIFFKGAQNGWIIGRGNVFLRTTNGGKDWTPQDLPYRDTLRSIFFIDRLNGWMCGDNGLVLNSSDGGVQWTRQPAGTGNNLRAVHFVDGKTGWVAGANGTILKTRSAGWKDLDDRWKSNKTTVLLQNFPNPLNQSTTFGFILLDPGRTTLTLYDILGRRVAVLLDQILPAGPYEIAWNAGGIPAGLYICRMESAKTTRAIKVVVAR
jgi:photosystem II stability/assembly factor-like uncharacterized protein